MADQLYHFDYRSLSAETVDTANAIIRGVSVITNGVTARGHNLEVDDKTLQQLLECGKNKGKVPVKYNHQSGVENVGGYLFNFRIEGKKLRADWQLMASHKETPATLEKAEKMPECFGLSAAFMGKEESKGGKKFARCTELLAVDCVAQPAANPDGMFGAKVDSPRKGMADDTNLSPEEKLLKKFEALEAQNTELAAALSGIQQFNAELVHVLFECEDDECEDDEGEEDDSEDEGEDEDPPAKSKKEMSAVEQRVIALEAEIANAKKAAAKAEEEEAFSEVEQRFTALVSERDELKAKVEALELSLKQGNGGKASTGGDSHISFGSADGKVTEFESRVNSLIAEGKSKKQAVELAQKEDLGRYESHLRAKGVIK